MKNLVFLVFITFFGSCVANRKYNDLLNSRNSLDKNYRDSLYALKNSRSAYNAEVNKNKKLNTEYDRTNSELNLFKAKYDQIERMNKELNSLYEKMLANSTTITNKASQEAKELAESQNRLKSQLDERESQIRKLEAEMLSRERSVAELDQRLKEREANLEQMSGSKTKLESTLAEREKRVNELEKMLNDQKERANALKNNLTNALKSFSASDLTVEEREGKVYVSLSQKLLFATGSKSIDNQGKLAISKLAEVLKKNKETLITVEGHTDSDGDETANWTLSVGRATTIVNEMIKSGVAPDQLIASGRGEHYPVSDNGTTEGKAKNRRSEIIITPDLSKLYQLINTN